MDLLKKLTDEFIAIYEKSPARLKSKLNSIKALAQGASNRQGQVKDKKADQDWKVSDMMNMKMYHPAEIAPTSSSNNNGSQNDLQQQSGGITQPMLPPPPHPQTQQMRKTELHTSSQHRSHHSSSSSSATSSSSSTHHPPKLGYTPGDVPGNNLNFLVFIFKQILMVLNLKTTSSANNSSSSNSRHMVAVVHLSPIDHQENIRHQLLSILQPCWHLLLTPLQNHHLDLRCQIV